MTGPAMVQGLGTRPLTAETDFNPKPIHVRFVVDKVYCVESSSVYCGFPVSHSNSVPYSFTDLTPMLKYKCTYNLIKRQRRYKNHVTIWRLIYHANSFSCHRFVINALYSFCKDSKRHGVPLQSESIAELFSLRPAPREP